MYLLGTYNYPTQSSIQSLDSFSIFYSKHVISTFLFLRANRLQNYRKEEEKEERGHRPASLQRGGAVTSPLPFTGMVPGDAPL
jgi:hypothetical protein